MNKITVVCHKDHSHGYEDFEGKCLLCVVDALMLEIGNLMIQKRKAEKREWVGLTDDEIRKIEYSDDKVEYELFDEGEYGYEINIYPRKFARAIEAKLKEKNT